VLTDGAGAVTVNAFQDDSTLMRAYMRVGIVVGTPLGADGSTVQKPLALAATTAVTGLSADAYESREPAGGTEAEEARAEGLAEREALREQAAAAQAARDEAASKPRSRRKAAE
jgi:flagellar motor protein MotB